MNFNQNDYLIWGKEYKLRSELCYKADLFDEMTLSVYLLEHMMSTRSLTNNYSIVFGKESTVEALELKLHC